MVFDARDFVRSPDKRNVPKTPHKSKFDKQREEDVIRNAHERGYLKSATEEAIWENIGDKCDLKDINFLNMSSIHLHTVRSIDCCINLKICVLASNYIKSFDALGHCRQLVFLDLHSNQITKIPGHKFWAGLQSLTTVFLHDNGISRLEYIQYMASSPSLNILTLYDSPLSLKPNYRHHIVNSLWSLKTLDHHVISDEEIIEDASFGGRFAALHPSFHLDMSAPIYKDYNSYEEALKSIQQLRSQVNRIQAQNSPVLIIQKFVRGHLSRQKVKYLQDLRIWAAVSIQRFYRHYKGQGQLEPYPPPSSPAPSRSSSAVIHLDYDSYVKGMRANITPRSSEDRIKQRSSNKSVSIVVEPVQRINEERESIGKVTVSPATPSEEKSAKGNEVPVRITTRVTINLRRLETSTSDVIKAKEEAVTVERGLGLDAKRSKMSRDASKNQGLSTHPSGEKDKPISTHPRDKTKTKSKELVKEEKSMEERRKRKKNRYRVGRYPTVKVFFGPVLETHPRSEKRDPLDTDQVPRIHFRLAGLEPPINTTDPLLEMLASKREAGIEVRKVAREYEMKVLNEPRKVIVPEPKMTTDQRLFLRTHGTMGLACLRAVQQAYRDRERAESASSRSEKVTQMREERLQSRGRVAAYRQEYQETTLRRRVREGVKTAEVMKEREERRAAEHDRLHTARAVTAEQKRSRQADLMFINDFSCQQTSVSNALLKHDRVSHKDETIHEVSDVVRKEKELSQEQQSLVKRYMEHRQLLRQAETAMARAELDARMTQETSQRVANAKTRVAQLKLRNQHVQEFSAVPPTNAPPPLPPLGVVSPDQVEVWERLPRFHWIPHSHERARTEPANTTGRSRPHMYSFEPEFGLV